MPSKIINHSSSFNFWFKIDCPKSSIPNIVSFKNASVKQSKKAVALGCVEPAENF